MTLQGTVSSSVCVCAIALILKHTHPLAERQWWKETLPYTDFAAFSGVKSRAVAALPSPGLGCSSLYQSLIQRLVMKTTPPSPFYRSHRKGFMFISNEGRRVGNSLSGSIRQSTGEMCSIIYANGREMLKPFISL